MLPEGFHWNEGPEPQLRLGEHVIAVTARLETGWRIDKNPNRTMRRSVFLEDEASVRRYLEAWARKWEAALRSGYGS